MSKHLTAETIKLMRSHAAYFQNSANGTIVDLCIHVLSLAEDIELYQKEIQKGTTCE